MPAVRSEGPASPEAASGRGACSFGVDLSSRFDAGCGKKTLRLRECMREWERAEEAAAAELVCSLGTSDDESSASSRTEDRGVGMAYHG